MAAEQNPEFKTYWGFVARYSEVMREGNVIDVSLVIASEDDSFPIDEAMTKARDIEKEHDLMATQDHCIALVEHISISLKGYTHFHPRIRGRNHSSH